RDLHVRYAAFDEDVHRSGVAAERGIDPHLYVNLHLAVGQIEELRNGREFPVAGTDAAPSFDEPEGVVVDARGGEALAGGGEARREEGPVEALRVVTDDDVVGFEAVADLFRESGVVGHVPLLAGVVVAEDVDFAGREGLDDGAEDAPYVGFEV